MTNDITIRRRPDGSIETDFFVNKGRHQRSQAARKAVGSIRKRSSTLAATFTGLILLVLPHGGQG